MYDLTNLYVCIYHYLTIEFYVFLISYVQLHSTVFVRGAHTDKLKVKGPVKMPTKVLHIKYALSCVEGTLILC